MVIGRVRRASRYINRYGEIFSVLMKYGLADWAHRIDLDFIKDILKRRTTQELLDLSTEERVRRALMELGPTFIKFGQVLSVRPDIVGVPLSEELKRLQFDVDPDPYEVVERIIEEELGRKIPEIFDDFDPKPVASASIGQVHRAALKTGEKVAVKVRHKDIEKTVETDIDILTDLAGILEDYVDESKHYRPRETVARFARTIRREMDFNREGRHIINLYEDLDGDATVKIPLVYENLTSPRTVVMEWMEGVRFSELAEEEHLDIDRQELARKGAELFLKMIFINGYYHADPHPGNLMVCGEGRVGLLDFGMMGRLSPKMREDIEDIVTAAMAKDSEKLARVIVKAGSTLQETDQTALGMDVTEFISYYGSLPVSKLRLFEGLNEMVDIIHRHHIILPGEIMLLIKTLVTLEGTGRALSPDFNLLSLIEPYREQMDTYGISMVRRINRVNRFYEEFASFVENVPPALEDIIERFRKGSLEIHMEHRGLEHSANRIVFGIVTSALFVGSSLLVAFKAPPVIWDYSVFGVLGYMVSVVMGLRILWAIMVSGRLE